MSLSWIRNRVSGYLFLFLIASLFGILMSLWNFAIRFSRGAVMNPDLAPFLWELPAAYLWLVLIPLAYRLTSDYPLHATRTGKLIAIHLALALLFSFGHLCLNLVLSNWLYGFWGESLLARQEWCSLTFLLRLTWRVLLYSFILIGCYAVRSYSEAKQKRNRNSILEAQLSAARVQEFKMRIDKNFVSLTLSTIRNSIETSPSTAMELILRLARFFRLLNVQQHNATIQERMKLLQAYLEVEKARFLGRLKTKLRVDECLRKKRIDEILLHRIIQTILVARMSMSTQTCRILIRLKACGDRFRILVSDDSMCGPDDLPKFAELKKSIQGFIPILRFKVGVSGLRIVLDPGSTPKQSMQNGSESDRHSGRPQLYWIFGIGSTFLFFFLTRQMLILFALGTTFSRKNLTVTLFSMLSWIALAPLVIRLARRFQLKHLTSFFFHWFFAFVLSAVPVSLHFFSRFTWDDYLVSFFRSTRQLGYPDHVMIYWLIVLFANGYWFYRQKLNEDSRESQLQTLLSNAQLKALEMQLHPHFLFNTLHAIYGLIVLDKKSAIRMLEQLERFFDWALSSSGSHMIPLHEELAFSRCYLDIQQIRFQNRLKVDTDVPSEALCAQVPQLILQPLLENAIRHGISKQIDQSTIQLTARLEQGWLSLNVKDNGPGMNHSNNHKSNGAGIGLQNTASRLQALYGSSHDFYFGNHNRGGFEVKIRIPAG